MDWIERWFGLSPDGGNGLFETLILAVALIAALEIGRRFGKHRDRAEGKLRQARTHLRSS